MKRRIFGVDVNGWHDVSARDWDAETCAALPEPLLLDGGVDTCAIRDMHDRWIGGPQAILAPHGRGEGWGPSGALDRRLPIREALRLDPREPAHADAVKAALEAMTRGAEDMILAVPDLPDFDEAAQARLLAVAGRCRLLWRPVAAFLSALAAGAVDSGQDGAAYGFLIHAGAGFEYQILRLRHDGDHAGHVAPERDGPGVCLFKGLGLERLLAAAREQVRDANRHMPDEPMEQTRLASGLLTGRTQPGRKEILRDANGTWLSCIAPVLDLDRLPELEDDADVPSLPRGIKTFLLTPLDRPLRSKLLSGLEKWFETLTELDWRASARGCLLAGRLIGRGLPHYFDRLTAISLAVMNAQTREPEFKNLIRCDATLPANREYVSPPFSSLRWRKGSKVQHFYVLKGDREVRHWTISLPQAPARDVGVEMQLRQTPGQSWARLVLTSREWEELQRAPIHLDWAVLNPIDKTPEQVLDELRHPPPVIPDRIIEHPHLDFWVGTARIKGIGDTLLRIPRQGIANPKDMARLLRPCARDPGTGQRLRGVGTDGTLPDDLAPAQREAFDALLQRYADQVTTRIRLDDNHMLMALTWSFTRCPAAVQERLVEAIEAYAQGGRDRLHDGARARRKVLIQGAGRAVTGISRLKRLLGSLSRLPPNADVMNALAMILSRREDAPRALDGPLVRALATSARDELAILLAKGSFKVRFHHTLSALTGLFRYREVERSTLLQGDGAIADDLHDQISAFIDRFEQDFLSMPQKAKTLHLLRGVLAYLEGGGDPGLLTDLEPDTDETDEAEI